MNIKEQLGQQVDQLVQVAGESASQLPGAAKSLSQRGLLGARRLGAYLRTIRITRVPIAALAAPLAAPIVALAPTSAPEPTRPSMKPGLALLGGIAAGTALMYLLDPEEGQRRRGLIRDKAMEWTRMGRDKATALADKTRQQIGSQTEKVTADLDELAESASGELQAMGPGNGSLNGFNSVIDQAERVASEVS